MRQMFETEMKEQLNSQYDIVLLEEETCVLVSQKLSVTFWMLKSQMENDR